MQTTTTDHTVSAALIMLADWFPRLAPTEASAVAATLERFARECGEPADRVGEAFDRLNYLTAGEAAELADVLYRWSDERTAAEAVVTHDAVRALDGIGTVFGELPADDARSAAAVLYAEADHALDQAGPDTPVDPAATALAAEVLKYLRNFDLSGGDKQAVANTLVEFAAPPRPTGNYWLDREAGE
jgi:hypothetical protein